MFDNAKSFLWMVLEYATYAILGLVLALAFIDAYKPVVAWFFGL